MHHFLLDVQVDDCSISIKLVSNHNLVMDFISFLWARSTSTQALLNTIYKLKQVVEWLSVEDVDGDEAKLAHLRKLKAMLESLSKKFYTAFPFGKLTDESLHAQRPPLPSKDAVFDWQQGAFKALAMQAVLDVHAAEPGSDVHSSATVVHDFALCNMMYGHTPTLRAVVHRTVQAPTAYSQQPYACQNADCKVKNCRGNRLQVVAGKHYVFNTRERVSLQPLPKELHVWDMLLEPEAAAPSPSPSPSPVAAGSGKYVTETPGGGQHARWRSDSDSDEGSDYYFGNGGDDDEEEEWHASAEYEVADDYYYGDDGDGDGDGYLQPYDEEEEQGADAAGATTSTKQIIPERLHVLELVIPHHKNEGEWGPWPLTFELPYEMAMVLHLYFDGPYQVVSMGGEHNYAFMNTETGEPFLEPEQLTTKWHAMQRTYGATWESFPPTAFRDVHISDKVMHLAQAVAATGMDLHGDATVMQNTPNKVWERHYMKNASFYTTMVGGAIDRITNWRLGKHAALLQHEHE